MRVDTTSSGSHLPGAPPVACDIKFTQQVGQDQVIHRAIDTVSLDFLFPSASAIDLDLFDEEEEGVVSASASHRATAATTAAGTDATMLDEWQQASIDRSVRPSL